MVNNMKYFMSIVFNWIVVGLIQNSILDNVTPRSIQATQTAHNHIINLSIVGWLITFVIVTMWIANSDTNRKEG